LFSASAPAVQKRLLDSVGSLPLPVKTSCSYSLVSAPLLVFAPSEPARWKPIGEVGCVPLPSHYLSTCVDFERPVNKRRGCQFLRPMHASGEERAMVCDLLQAGIVKPSSGSFISFNLSLRPKPGSAKSLLIADMRNIISGSIWAPKKFSLPKLEKLYEFPPQQLWFAKLDLTNAYHSVLLPGDVSELLRFGIGDEVFQWLRLPFGWDRSPVIFQSFMNDLLASVNKCGVVRFQYLDDILIVGLSRGGVNFAIAEAMGILTAKGFIISDKSAPRPATSVQWLGKSITSTPGGIHISVPPSLCDLMSCLAVFACSKRGPARVLRTLCGLVAWANSHSRLAFPWLQHAHRSIMSQAHTTPQVCFDHLLVALDAVARPASRFQIAWRKPPSVASPVVWVDAAASEGRFGLVLCVPGDLPLAWSLPLPAELSFSLHQQTAELYAVKVAAVKFLSVFPDLVVISDSASSLFACVKLSCKAKHLFRGKILRQVSRKLLMVPGAAVSLGFIRGVIHPADVYSRLAFPLGVSWSGLAFPTTKSLCDYAWPQVLWDPLPNSAPSRRC